MTLWQPVKARRPGRDLHSSEPSIRTILDTSVYTVRVCGLRLTNTGHENTGDEAFKSQKENKYISII